MSDIPQVTFDTLFAQKLLDMLFVSKAIIVPKEFHVRCSRIQELLSNDVSGLVNTFLNYQIESATATNYQVACANKNVEKLLNLWLEDININIDGVPTGLKELSTEYFKERWMGSSLCILRAENWKKIEYGGNTIKVPTTLYFYNGASIYIDGGDETNFELGSWKYYTDKKKEKRIIDKEDSKFLVQKIFGRWFTKYPIPYIILKGIYKNSKSIELLQDKGDEAITKILPYMLLLKKGTEALYQKGIVQKDADLKAASDYLSTQLETFKQERGKIPLGVFGYDTTFEHLIPDMSKILSENLFVQSYKALLAGLGFVDVVQGLTSTRKEAVLNPKPFISEINSGVGDFISLLTDLLNIIITENKLDHKKLFSKENNLRIIHTPLKINIEIILDFIRSTYDRGTISIQSFCESIGFDFDTEKERRLKELENGDEELFFPHLIQNLENVPDRVGVPAKPKNENIPQKVKKGTPESKNFKAQEDIVKCECGHEFDYLLGAIIEGQVTCPNCSKAVTKKDLIDSSLDLIIAPYTKENHPSYLDKYPQDAIDLWIKVFNESLPKGEDYAYPVAWSVMRKFLKKNYIKKDGNWVKKEN